VSESEPLPTKEGLYESFGLMMKPVSAETSLGLTGRGAHSKGLLGSAIRSITTQPSGLCSEVRVKNPCVLCDAWVGVTSWEVTAGFDRQRQENPVVVGILFVRRA
jgi:hypothetical protein